VNCPVEDIVNVPCVGAVLLITRNLSPLASVSFLSALLAEVTVSVVFAAVLYASSLASGGELTALAAVLIGCACKESALSSVKLDCCG